MSPVRRDTFEKLSEKNDVTYKPKDKVTFSGHNSFVHATGVGYASMLLLNNKTSHTDNQQHQLGAYKLSLVYNKSN